MNAPILPFPPPVTIDRRPEGWSVRGASSQTAPPSASPAKQKWKSQARHRTEPLSSLYG